MPNAAGDRAAPVPLAILAGGGQVPQQLIDHLIAQGQSPLVIAFHGETDRLNIAPDKLRWVKVGAVGQLVKFLKLAEIKEVVLVGTFRRPDFKHLKLDLAGAGLLPKLLKAAAVGDDALLRVIIDYLEKQGFLVQGVDALLGDVTVAAGCLTTAAPNRQDFADIRRGIAVVNALGRLDIGQATVVRDGYVLAVEAAEGTDRMLKRCGDFATAQPAGILIKRAKPQQDRRVDLPTIGPKTVQNAAAANLRGIAVEANATLLASRDKTIRDADTAGLFIYGFDSTSTTSSEILETENEVCH